MEAEDLDIQVMADRVAIAIPRSDELAKRLRSQHHSPSGRSSSDDWGANAPVGAKLLHNAGARVFDSPKLAVSLRLALLDQKKKPWS